MSEENVELARQAYGAYNREGINGILENLDPAVEWRNPIESPNAGVFVGPEGVLEWQRMVDDAFEEMHFEPERIEESSAVADRASPAAKDQHDQSAADHAGEGQTRARRR